MMSVSPTIYLHQVKTPLLIMVGDKDRRVPMSQGIEFFRTLKAMGVKSR